MRLNNLLVRKKAAIISKWFAMVIETYPSDTAQFLRSQKDPFANPVGRTVYHGLENLFDQLLTGMDLDSLTACLDPIIRIRAVQNFNPSQAVGFIFFLKDVIRTHLDKEIAAEQLAGELVLFESKIDALILMAFNLYMQCREKIYELKANEVKNRTFKAFERAGLVKELPDVDPVLEPIINFTKEASNNT